MTQPFSHSRQDPAVSERRQCQHRQQVFEVAIIRSRRKTLAIHVMGAGQVEVRAPLKCSWRFIDEFLSSRLDWIVAALEQLARTPPPAQPTFTDGEYHDYLGRPRRLTLVRGKPNTVLLSEHELLVRCAEPGDQQRVKRLLENCWRQRAAAVFEERLAVCAQQFSPVADFGQLSVRKMTARWGSCSRRGDICLNTLLVQKPVSAIDMVITHELCHLTHFSHSKPFYALMAAVMPDWQRHEALLNQPSWRPADGVTEPLT